METQDILSKGVGTKEKPKLLPKRVKIASVRVQTKTKTGEDMKSSLVHFECIHPDKKQDELISISKVRFLDGEKVKTLGFWVQTDEDGNIQKGSTIDTLLTFLNCKNLSETIGKDIDTIEESKESQFLVLKAY